MRKDSHVPKTSKKIKSIAFVVWLFPKLSETFVLNQMIYLKKKGYKISIFAVKDLRKQLAKEDIEFEKVIHEDVKKHKFLSSTTYGSCLKLNSLIRRQIKEGTIDIVYFQFPDLANKMLKHGAFQVPTIVTFHDIPKFQSRAEIEKLKKKYEKVFNRATFVLATSSFTKKELIRLGCKEHKILVHHMGVDTDRFKLRPKKFPKHHFNFAMIGRFVEKKGFKYGIKAFKRLVKKHPYPKLQLHIVGDGLLREKLHREAKNSKLENYIFFHGKMPHKKVLQILHATQVLICPGITTKKGKREGLPVVILEAAGCGIPIIATDHAAIPEVINKGCGILVKEKSISELEKAMSKMVENYSFYRKKFSKRARQFISEEYNIKKLGSRLLEIFDRAVEVEKQKLAFKNFALYLEKHLSPRILSVIITGSIARQEKISKESDIDILIVFKNQGPIRAESLLKFKKGVSLLNQALGLRLVPQVFNELDLFQLLSPVLIKSYVKDGEVIYGKNIIKLFKDRLLKLSPFEFEISILKRCLFERYLVRQYIVVYPQEPDYSFCYRLAKNVLFLARDFLYITKGRYITSREEIVKTWNSYYKDNTPYQALQIINYNYDFRFLLSFVNQSIEYVEKITNKIFNTLKRKYPKKKIYISPF